MKTSIKFINHASVKISDGNISVLSDPWYEGDVFNRGWSLLHKTNRQDINKLLNEISHIWISHEHPDHFSIPFFKTYANKIKNNSIKILFQKTKDKRVYNFLVSLGLNVEELVFNKSKYLSKDFSITCFKDGFFDSGLLIESHSEKILNLNDCNINSINKAEELFRRTGKIDVLLTQFSFAAWKGGKKNKKWRIESALEKINNITIQIEKFKPKYVIPFASFFYFSHSTNFYLNQSTNKLKDVKKKLRKYNSKIVIMSPNDILGGKQQNLDEFRALKFWAKKYELIKLKKLNKYNKISLKMLHSNFKSYHNRIKKNNNLILIKIIRKLSPIKFFKPTIIKIEDLAMIVKIDYVNATFVETNESPMISMQSESINYIFLNSFGFDTLTVNGCFEEVKKGGFIEATKSLAIENLNNLGFKIELKTLFNFSLIKLFFSHLNKVSNKLNIS